MARLGCDGAAGGLGNLGCRLLQHIELPAGNDHVSAVLGKRLRHLAAQTATPAGDQGTLSAEIEAIDHQTGRSPVAARVVP